MALTQKDLDEIERRLQDVFATKDDLLKVKSDLINHLDKILKEIIASRQEQTIIGHQVTENHQRISALEQIHPGGQHPF